MSGEYDKILTLTQDQQIELAQHFREELHKELVIGQTRFMCRYGTLSDGHDSGITEAQRYYSAKRCAWQLSNEMMRTRSKAKEAQADLLDAKEELAAAVKESQTLRAQSKIELTTQRIGEMLVGLEDSLRQLDEYHRVIKELQPMVRAKYPEGIEQAELDNWTAVAEYKALKRQMGSHEQMTYIPLPPEAKARIGIENGAPDMTAWYLIQHKDEVKEKYNGNWLSFLESKLGLGENGGKRLLDQVRK